jgi:hypothetical protein
MVVVHFQEMRGNQLRLCPGLAPGHRRRRTGDRVEREV